MFNDVKARFLYADNLYFCRNDEILPCYQDIAFVDKIIIQKNNDKEERITITGEDINTFVQQISDYKNKEKKLDISKSVGVVEVYYKDYPACQWIGELVLLRNGEYAFCMYDDEDEYMITSKGVYIKDFN